MRGTLPCWLAGVHGDNFPLVPKSPLSLVGPALTLLPVNLKTFCRGAPLAGWANVAPAPLTDVSAACTIREYIGARN